MPFGIVNEYREVKDGRARIQVRIMRQDAHKFWPVTGESSRRHV